MCQKQAKKMAEDTGFEPADPLRSTVFKTAAFDHSANPPHINNVIKKFKRAILKKSKF